ncbi:mannose-1-phosphate guanylyltransferase [Luteibaculum oceani]|uniref:mannose-1-phosphate guanylyltransferase n=1 Tax=Luteibaculum oceani TaxID=1294296 RepID=A0A5C6V8R1_9FLAO|nr:mannose-1-phosphate guanylyltransferase [Luteibaculum oceani]TXC81802.1 mannose-1-phosphate guanylyltransferase [Luteibaculum oceani]
MRQNHYAVIMAGGIGSRFWPMSTDAFPKQFHDVLGTGKTLIQQTFSRLNKTIPAENILVVTNSAYKSLVAEQLPEMKEAHILCEPSRRNTAPCIAYAAMHIKSQCKDATMIVAPSDHLIMDENEFSRIIEKGMQHAEQSHDLVTLGIKPSRPDTGYGYIQFKDGDKEGEIKPVKTFTEKPNLELAKSFIKSGDFYWNSGIFIWTVNDILQRFEQHLPEMFQLFADEESKFAGPEEEKAIESIYQNCTNISIDYGIMENDKNVSVVLSDFGWSDLGTWGSLYGHVQQDEDKNAIVGKKVQMYDSEGCMVSVPQDKLVVLQGLKDYIVVESNGVLLVCKKKEEQRIKQFLADVKSKKLV